ncbi:MAG: peptidase [Calditrichaceae bacterium]
MKVLLIFIDGLGVGENDELKNPCCHLKTGIFNHFQDISVKKQSHDGFSIGLDACLGVQGLPQSATGQTSIYTGINAADLLGYHLFRAPNAALRELLTQQSIFKDLTTRNFRSSFVNAFRPVFFTTPEIFRGSALSATVIMNQGAGLPFKQFDDLKNHRALYHDITNEIIQNMGFEVEPVTVKRAAEILVRLSDENDLTLFEYFLTDKAGHKKDMKMSVRILRQLENFIMYILEMADLSRTAVIVISDHGNIEDLSVKSHTFNPAFAAFWGKSEFLHQQMPKSLLDIYPIILNLVMAV